MLTAHERMLARRYLLPGRSGRLMLLVAAIGCTGVMIGVASLILVISFMNGAEARLAGQVASIDGHLAVTRVGHDLPDWRRLTHHMATTPGVVRAVPVLAQAALVTVAGRVQAVDLHGLQTSDIARLAVFQRPDVLVAGHLPTVSGEVAVGTGLAARLGIGAGDPIGITSARTDPDGMLRVETTGFIVAGLFRTENARYDDGRVVVPIADVQHLFARGDVASHIDVTAMDDAAAPRLASLLRSRLPTGIMVREWRDLNTAMVSALAQERVAMAAIVSMVTMIALANILSSLGMMVRFKAREIAIIRTMGASSGSVARIFVTVGATIGIAGELAGLALGLGLKAAKDPLAAALRPWVGGSMEYDVFLDLPLTISPVAIATILLTVTSGALLATLLPARRAATIDPAIILRDG